MVTLNGWVLHLLYRVSFDMCRGKMQYDGNISQLVVQELCVVMVEDRYR